MPLGTLYCCFNFFFALTQQYNSYGTKYWSHIPVHYFNLFFFNKEMLIELPQSYLYNIIIFTGKHATYGVQCEPLITENVIY